MFAYVLLSTNDAYMPGVLTVAALLNKYNTKYDLVLLITSQVSENLKNIAKNFFTKVLLIDELVSNEFDKLRLMSRPDLNVAMTKLRMWNLTGYSKCLYLDADTMPLTSLDNLFDEFDGFAAAPDIGWPDCFNSGVYMFSPDPDIYSKLLGLAEASVSFDGADQGLLNEYFGEEWRSSMSGRLPFVYNVTANVHYTYVPAWKRYGEDIKNIHFIGQQKPWMMKPDASDFYSSMWWQSFNELVQPHLSPKKRMEETVTNETWNKPEDSKINNISMTMKQMNVNEEFLPKPETSNEIQSDMVATSYEQIEAHLDSIIYKK
ncbi:hypothetical protein SNEBB_006740 [Seison nebaliae]|nr:hypothetical protein SNEBB_006740 [Seison nebaliae]